MKHKEKVRRHRSQKPMTMGSQWRQAEDVQRKTPSLFQVCVMSSVAIAGSRAPPLCPPLSRKDNWWSLSAKNIA